MPDWEADGERRGDRENRTNNKQGRSDEKRRWHVTLGHICRAMQPRSRGRPRRFCRKRGSTVSGEEVPYPAR